MFETAELGHKLKKKEFQELVPTLRTDLVRLQVELREADFPVVVVLEGDDRIGVRQSLRLASEWLDPRFLGVDVFSSRYEGQLEASHPLFWRYWTRLPARGRIGILASAWTGHVILEQIELPEVDELLLERRLRHVRAFERMLVEDGALLLKAWLHIPRSELKKRIKAADDDRATAWQVTDSDRRFYQEHDQLMPLIERVLRLTSVGGATWQIVESTDARYRDATIAQGLRAALAQRLDEGTSPPVQRREPTPTAPAALTRSPKTLLGAVDLSASLSEEKYDKQLDRWQGELAALTRDAFDRGISSVLAFQGWDAAGKGGAIRRVSAAIDASICRIVSIAAPSEEEKAHPYLWRFWRRLPRRGRVRIFDRSWYERVLVERVEGFASEDEWGRAYAEIVDFEEQLCEHGIVLLKFWLHIDADEQLRRFQEREQTPFKQYKITEHDYRNRERWGDYERAVDDMVSRTDTPHAPWHLVAANDKRHARIEVLKVFCRAVQEKLAASE